MHRFQQFENIRKWLNLTHHKSIQINSNDYVLINGSRLVSLTSRWTLFYSNTFSMLIVLRLNLNSKSSVSTQLMIEIPTANMLHYLIDFPLSELCRMQWIGRLTNSKIKSNPILYICSNGLTGIGYTYYNYNTCVFHQYKYICILKILNRSA